MSSLHVSRISNSYPCAKKDHLHKFAELKDRSKRCFWNFWNRTNSGEDSAGKPRWQKGTKSWARFRMKIQWKCFKSSRIGSNFNLMYLREYLVDWDDFWHVGSGKFFSFDFSQPFLRSEWTHLPISVAKKLHPLRLLRKWFELINAVWNVYTLCSPS